MNKLCKRSFLLILFLCFSSYSQRLSAVEYSSMDDSYDFRKFCLDASTDDIMFQNFKLYPIYQQFIERVPYEFGMSYLKIIKEKYPGLLGHLEAFQGNDIIGNPYTYLYDIGRFSPTTLRYIKVAGDIMGLFPDLTGKRVIEIGGGYGGQCKILSDLVSFQEYTIVDLPEPLALTKKYLEILNVPNVRYLTPDQVEDESYDLVISNYAFSECSRKAQGEYLDKILKNGNGGYMTMNFIPFPYGEKPYTTSELVSTLIKDPLINVRIYPEDPLTCPKNVIFVWRKK